ncbi:OmpA family protein, partial [Bacillus sp. SS-TM]
SKSIRLHSGDLLRSKLSLRGLAARLASTGLTHARMDGHTDNYGEDSYNEGLSLKRANVVADAWAMGGQIPRIAHAQH